MFEWWWFDIMKHYNLRPETKTMFKSVYLRPQREGDWQNQCNFLLIKTLQIIKVCESFLQVLKHNCNPGRGFPSPSRASQTFPKRGIGSCVCTQQEEMSVLL